MDKKLLRYFMENGYIEAEDLPELVEDGLVAVEDAEALLECHPEHDVATGRQDAGSDWAIRKGMHAAPKARPDLKAKARRQGGEVDPEGPGVKHRVLTTERAKLIARIRERSTK